MKKLYNRHANKYNTAIKGTIFSVTLAILLIPPIIITPTNKAKIHPIIAPEAVLSKPNISLITIVA